MQTITKHSQEAFQFRTPTTAIEVRFFDSLINPVLRLLLIAKPQYWWPSSMIYCWPTIQQHGHSLEIISQSCWPQVDDVKSSWKECNWSFADRLGLRYQLQKLHSTPSPWPIDSLLLDGNRTRDNRRGYLPSSAVVGSENGDYSTTTDLIFDTCLVYIG